MSERPTEAAVRLRLRRLAKGALFVGITAGYALLLGLTLVLFGWRPALLAVFFVLTGLCFRHIAHEADRIGLGLEGGPADEPTQGYQRRMLRVFGVLTQLPNVGLAVQAFVLAGIAGAAAATGALLIVELLYVLVRRLNRRTAYEQASFGFREPGPLGAEAVGIDAPGDVTRAEVERRLTELRAMVEDGRVSQRAYEKACDRYRVRAVMAREGG